MKKKGSFQRNSGLRRFLTQKAAEMFSEDGAFERPHLRVIFAEGIGVARISEIGQEGLTNANPLNL